MDKINVLQISNQLGVGGTERCLEVFTRHLDKNIFNVYVCGIQEGGIREKMLRGDGFDVSVVDSNYDSLFKLMRDNRIQVVHIHRAGVTEPLPIEAARKARVPVIVETNVFGGYDSSESGRLINSHLLISKTLSLRYAQKAGISINRLMRNSRVIYYPVDLREFDRHRTSDAQIQRFRSEIGVDKNTPLIGRVGRSTIAKWDNFPVDMMACLVGKLPDVRYLIVGGIPVEVKRRIEKLRLKNNFIETGYFFQHELIQIYFSIDILAHTSRVGESFGYTIAEAMAAHKPVVVNCTPWIDNAQIELVDNTKTGFVTSTPKTFADAIAYLVENKKEAREMGFAGHEKVEREYEAGKTTRILEKLYLELLSKKGVNGVQDLVEQYSEVQYFPTDSDMLNYPVEYRRRLSNRFGKSYPLEELRFRSKFVYEMFLNPLRECLRRRNQSSL